MSLIVEKLVSTNTGISAVKVYFVVKWHVQNICVLLLALYCPHIFTMVCDFSGQRRVLR